MSATVAGQARPATTETGAAVVEVCDLFKSFGEVHALDGLSLSVPPGITYGLLGPNGSGKTTLIRAIAGLVSPDKGTLRVLGQDVPRHAANIWPQIGYMTQAQAIYGDLTVYENVGFFAEIYGLSDKRRRQERIKAVLDLVGLSGRANSLTGNLSGGMKQRVSLATALVHEPRLLLLDEPTVGVDPQLRASFWTYFRSLNASGVTIIVSSHVMDEAERCDRLGLILAGRLLSEGTAAELRRSAGTETLEEAFLKFSSSAGVSANGN